MTMGFRARHINERQITYGSRKRGGNMLFVFKVVSKIFLQYMGNVLHCTYCKVEDVIISNNKKKITELASYRNHFR